MAKLSVNEIEALKKYRFSIEKNPSQHLILDGIDLLKREQLQEIFNKELQLKFNTDKQNVIGSMFIKRYAFLAALVLYSMSAFDKGLNCSLENISLQTDKTNRLWLPGFHFKDINTTTPVTNREQWRTSVVQTLFLENIGPIISTVSRYSKIAKTILWENVAVYIFWMYETLLEDNELTADKRLKIESDFRYVVFEAPPQLFGQKANNPLSRYYSPKQNDLRVRTTCCLFFLTSKNEDRCKTCPSNCRPVNV